MARVGFVVVSHSAKLAEGVVEVAAQMAPEVTLVAAGGTDDGGIGTSFDRVDAALEDVLGAVGDGEGAGVVLLSDLGSATMTIEAVLDFADDPDRLRFVNAPLVEGAVAAAVRAQMGGSLAEVAQAAADAGGSFAAGDAAGAGTGSGGDVPTVVASHAPATAEERAQGDAVVADPVGLHARPAAMLARLASSFDAEVTVNGADAASVLEVMALGVTQGQSVHLEATGPDAAKAVEALVAMIEEAAD